MSLRSLVKISSVNNLSDARYAAGMGVELMGFDLDESSDDFVSPERFGAITGWISGVKLVGEIAQDNLEMAESLTDAYQLDFLQINITDPWKQIYESKKPVIIKIDQLKKEFIDTCLERYSSMATWFLLEPEAPMSDDLLAWCTLKSQNYPIILGSNVSPDNVLNFIESGFTGIALKGGNELKPGMGNFDALADLLEALEIEG